MQLSHQDFNGAGALFTGKYAAAWAEIQATLSAMPLHLKASDQATLVGDPVFDPVGTNAWIKAHLIQPGWSANLTIPAEFRFLGTDVDFAKRGLLVEAQFSNYPFLLNNVVRSELFFKAKTPIGAEPADALIVITKAHMFPAAQSTLYYEQAQDQLGALARHKVFDVPIRLVGLRETPGATAPARWTTYSSSRRSRTVDRQRDCRCEIIPPRGARGRCSLRIR